ncbi:phosphoribosylanthranilate isomerase [Helicovermis profundi]|uniref:N-(5'-phosphoribosyl)anthranilate isomerase n=2 Tax=Helicovermis profundi TaxID=3065157 RepID=A0AAU9EHA9_9FIRM|nr:phosphoribosylanthranilate isomerase [Clostridia bacterium S502]
MNKAYSLVKLLDKNIKRVGVFVNSSADEINKISKTCELDIVQLHGDEDNEFIEKINLPVWKAIRVSSKEDLVKANDYNCERILFDSFSLEEYGGTGESFDWSYLRGKSSDYIIAGGINEDNVGLLITKYSPYLVDVSSSIETDGYKDENKIRKLIEKVRECNE